VNTFGVYRPASEIHARIIDTCKTGVVFTGNVHIHGRAPTQRISENHPGTLLLQEEGKNTSRAARGLHATLSREAPYVIVSFPTPTDTDRDFFV